MHEEEYIDLRRAVTVLRRRIAWVLGVPLAAMAIALGVSLYQTPQYEATAILLAGQGEGLADVQMIDGINRATQSLARMATNRVVIEQALREERIRDIDAVELSQRVSANVPTNTQQIELTVRDPDPERATRLANGIAETFSKLVEEKASPNSKLSATVWQTAIRPDQPSSPNIPLNLVLAFVLGLMGGIAMAFLREHFDATWQSEQEVEQALGVPVLAVIPDIAERSARERIYA